MKVLVCGGRDFKNYKQLCKVLDTLHKEMKFTLVLQGGAKGAEDLARDWAGNKGVPHQQFNTLWQRYSKGMIPVMKKYNKPNDVKPDLVVAFPGGSRTNNLVRYSARLNIKVIQVEIDEGAP